MRKKTGKQELEKRYLSTELYIERSWESPVGIPRDRKGEFSSKVIPKSRKMEEALVDDIGLMFFNGNRHWGFDIDIEAAVGEVDFTC